MEVAVGSDFGIWQRQQSDAHVAEAFAPNVTFLAVADGFGVLGKGVPTATLALTTIRDYLRRRQRHGAFGPRHATPSHLRALLLAAFDHANARLFGLSGSGEDFVGSGTSVTAVLVVGCQAFVAHVGDARAYLLRLGHVEPLTADDAMFTDDTLSGAKTSVPAKPLTRGLLWRSLENARRRWPGDLLVLPAHYAGERERRPDRSVGARVDVILATNPAAALADEATFLRWVAEHDATPPEIYRTIKLANLGLHDLTEADVEAAEAGPNQCAVGAG